MRSPRRPSARRRPRFARRAVPAAALALGLAAGGCDTGPPPDTVSGTVRIEPALAAQAQRARALIIVLEPEGGGQTLAIQRIVEPKLPLRYVLSADDMVGPRRPFAGRVRVRARLDADGELGPLVRGDFQGASPGAVPIGARGVDILINEMGTAEPPRVAKRRPPQAPPPAPAAPPAAPPAERAAISGTVSVAPALAAKAEGKRTLFLIARTAQAGPPLAVLRIEGPRFPQRFTLSQANVMMQGVPFAGRVRILARLDADGSVGSGAGDLEGSAPGPVAVGTKDVAIVLDREAGGAAGAPSAAAPPPSAMPRLPPSLSPPGAPGVPAPPGAAISGTIELAPALAARAAGKTVLYLIARPEAGGPPVAVMRIDNPRFPLEFTLSGQHGMGGGSLQGRVRVTARLDADGSAGPPAPGDLEGQTKEPVAAGATGVRIVLDKAY